MMIVPNIAVDRIREISPQMIRKLRKIRRTETSNTHKPLLPRTAPIELSAGVEMWVLNDRCPRPQHNQMH